MGKHIRNGFGAVRPYLYGDKSTLDLIAAIGGEVVENANGHIEARIGDGMVVVETKPDWPSTQKRQSIYVYVRDVDAAHAAAVKAGAVSDEAPKNMPYQERACTLHDGFGNTWYLSTHTG